VQVSLPAGVTITDIAAGYCHSLALASDGTVWAWGDNYYGQVGNGPYISNIPLQVSLPNGETITNIAAGELFSLALASNGTVWAWGDNTGGELGNGTNISSNIPVQISLPNGVIVTNVAAGSGPGASLALASNGTVWAWGDNSLGELGNGTNIGYSNIPVQVSLPSGVIISNISAGYEFSLALESNGINDSSWFFSQNDPRWAKDQMGTSGLQIGNTGSGSNFIVGYGCAETCAAMVLKYWGVNVNPGTLNTWLNNNNGYSSGSANIVWSKPISFNPCNLSCYPISRGTDNWTLLDSYLTQGPVIVEVDNGTHWVVVTQKIGSTHYINDPQPDLYSTISPKTLENTYKHFTEMVVYYPTPAPIVNQTSIQNGSASVADNTAIKVDINDSSAVDGTSATLTSAYYGAISPPGTTTLLLAGPSYFDINISSVSNLGANAVAQVYISSPLVTPQTLMQYWNGQIWNDVPNLSLSGTTISGLLPVSALGGTPFVIGNQSTTSITLTSSANPSNHGQLVTLDASFDPIPDGGTVLFQDNGVNLSPQINVDASGQVTYTTSNLSVGSHTITAVYAGDAYFMPCTATLTQVVNVSPHLKISADDDVSSILQSAANDFYNDTGIVLDITTESDSQAIQDLNNGNCDIAGVGCDSC